jgi:putative transcriptional regulator
VLKFLKFSVKNAGRSKKKEGGNMIVYKSGLLKDLRNAGWDYKRIRKENLLSESTLQAIRENRDITTKTMNTICLILKCQPSDIISVVPTDEEKIKFF